MMIMKMMIIKMMMIKNLKLSKKNADLKKMKAFKKFV